MYETYLRNLLAPLGIYDLTENSVSGAAVCTLGAGLDDVGNRLEEIEREGKFKGAAKGFAAMPHARTLYEIKNMYGRELAACSHGEGFLEFFKSRVHPRGLYILDEPESALSYENQYRLAYFIHAAAKVSFNDCMHRYTATVRDSAMSTDKNPQDGNSEGR